MQRSDPTTRRANPVRRLRRRGLAWSVATTALILLGGMTAAEAATITYLTDGRYHRNEFGVTTYPPAPFDPWLYGVSGSFGPDSLSGGAGASVYSSDGVGSGFRSQLFSITFSVDAPVMAQIDLAMAARYETAQASVSYRIGTGSWQDLIPDVCVATFDASCITVDEYELYEESHLVQLEPGRIYSVATSASAGDWALGSSASSSIQVTLVPEPRTALLVGLGLGMLALRQPRSS